MATEQRRIAGQDLLDSIEDRADDEDLAKRIDQIDSTQRVIAQAVDGYLYKMLAFSKMKGEDKTGDGWTRYGVNKKHPPLLTEEAIRGIGTLVFESAHR
jgi:hypothetical protein